MKTLVEYLTESLSSKEIFDEIQSILDLGEDSSDIIKSYIEYAKPKDVEFIVCKQQVDGNKAYEDAVKDIQSKVIVIDGEDKFNDTVKDVFGNVPQFFNIKDGYMYGGYEGNYYVLIKKVK